MAIVTGLGSNLYLDGVNASGDTREISGVRMSRALQDRTTIDLEAMARLALLADGSIDFTSFFDDDADATFEAVKALDATDLVATWTAATTRGAAGFSLVAKEATFGSNRAQDGSFMLSTGLVANGFGVDGVRMLTTGVETLSGAGSTTAVDELGTAGSTDFGLQAYLHVIAFTGTSATVTVQDSADGSTGWAAVGASIFTAATAAGAERIQTARTENVRRYLRLSVAGTFTDLQLAVAVTRNQAAVNF